MNKPAANVQDQFLNYLRKEKVPIVIHLTSGEKMHGIIKGFDNFALIVQDVGERLIYKHSIAVLAPEKPIQHFREIPDVQREEARGDGG